VQYLQEEQYYSDLYDLATIKDCLRSIQFWQKAYQDKKSEKAGSKKDKLKAFSIGFNLDLYYSQGERFRNRQETIRKMIERDKERQDFYDNAVEPSDIYCGSCGNHLFSDLKILEDYTDKPLRVLFYFSCKNCKKKRAFYDNGQEHISKPDLCSRCGYEIKTKYKREGKKIITVKKCTKCSFSETEIDDFEKRNKEWEKEKVKDKALLEKYRSKFCFSDKEGQEYIRGVENLKIAMNMIDEQNRKQADPAYQKVKTLNRLGVVDLEKLLIEVLKKNKYINLTFDKPEIGQHVIIPFTVQDSDSSRKDYESQNVLKKIIKQTLEETNWRLMTEGTTYRLGYVYGRLKGYENEDDLAGLFKNRGRENPR